MARTRKQICTVSGINTSINNFYTGQNHVKAVDNLRRNTGATKEQITRMFNQVNAYFSPQAQMKAQQMQMMPMNNSPFKFYVYLYGAK